MSLLADCFQEGEHDPDQMAAQIRAVSMVLGQALAVLLNNKIRFEVSNLAIIGMKTAANLADYIDQLEMYPLKEEVES